MPDRVGRDADISLFLQRIICGVLVLISEG